PYRHSPATVSLPRCAASSLHLAQGDVAGAAEGQLGEVVVWPRVQWQGDAVDLEQADLLRHEAEVVAAADGAQHLPADGHAGYLGDDGGVARVDGAVVVGAELLIQAGPGPRPHLSA